MKKLEITLPDELYYELLAAAARSTCALPDADFMEAHKFAEECVESVLAERRLKRMEACV
jgi:hypothetical protein